MDRRQFLTRSVSAMAVAAVAPQALEPWRDVATYTIPATTLSMRDEFIGKTIRYDYAARAFVVSGV